MIRETLAQFKPALILLVMMTVITGGLYPLMVTGIAGLIFPEQAEGSLIRQADIVVGSELIGQTFTDPAYFWSRPSAVGYDARTSSGSNYGPTSSLLQNEVKLRVGRLQAVNPDPNVPVPVDLVTASGSGLDPHISLAAAEYQIPRVARARGLDESIVRNLVESHTEGRQFGVLGEPRVNVVLLNLALDALQNE